MIKIMNPTTDITIVATVPMLSVDISKTSPHTTSANTAITSVSPPGNAFISTFLRKLPFILFLFGSRANKNPGTPIVNILTKEICAGSSGYVNIKTADNTAKSNEKIFFTKNRLAERSILLTTLLPSYTRSGICAKSESSSTTCAA